jgi:hypothetical protein
VGETYTARITTAALATDGLAMEADKVWTFTTTTPVYPTVLNTSPDSGGASDVPRSTTITAVFSKDMNPATITSSTFVVMKGAATVNGSLVYTAGSRSATFTPLAPDSPLDWGTTYDVTIVSGGSGVKATDGLDMQADFAWSFTTVTAVNPVVVNTAPALGASDVLPGAIVTATFSRDMKASTINGASFLLEVDGGAAVSGVVTFDGTTMATFTPAAPLTPGITYRATVTSAIQDADDLPLLADVEWTFKVQDRPEVLSVTPAANAVGASRGTLIKAVFSKNIKASTIVSPATTFDVRIGATSIPGTVTYDPLTFTATFTPTNQLEFTPYTATIDASVTDTFDIAMAADFPWTFTTIPALGEPMAANNKITPTSTDPVTIFIPQPPASAGGANARVTVQVFTATGKKVATLVNNQAWSSFQASLPLEWDGTNGRGEPLGPGLYFIQIRATGYLRTLKVMIVR